MIIHSLIFTKNYPLNSHCLVTKDLRSWCSDSSLDADYDGETKNHELAQFSEI